MTRKNTSQSRQARRQTRDERLFRLAPNAFTSGQPTSVVKFQVQSSDDQQLYHNVAANLMNQHSLLSTIAAGTAYNNRLTNRIFVRHLDFRLILNNKAARPNVTYRIVVVATPQGASNDTFAECFIGNTVTAVHDPNNSVVLYEQVVQSGSMIQGSAGGGSFERSHSVVFTVPINKPVTYSIIDGAPSTVLTAYVVSYDAYGTLTTDNIASAPSTTLRISFEDV